MTKRKTVIIIIIIISILALISIFAPVKVDKFLWGDKFKDSVIDNNYNQINYLITKENAEYIKDGNWNYIGFYYNSDDKDPNGLITKYYDLADFPYRSKIKDSISYEGRHIYMTVYFMYKGEINEIGFEGTRWFFGKYSWKMLDNDFFPINDPNFHNAGDVIVK